MKRGTSPSSGVQTHLSGFPGPQTNTQLTVVCIDASAGRNSLGAYAAEYKLPSWNRIANRNFASAATRKNLVAYVADRLQYGPVAMGVEAPLWGLHAVVRGVSTIFSPCLPRPFEVNWPHPKAGQQRSRSSGTYPPLVSNYWYVQAGGAMALLGSRELARLVSTVVPIAKQQVTLTYGNVGPAMRWQPWELLLWEAFVPTALKAPTGCAQGTGSGHVRDAAHAVECGFAAVGRAVLGGTGSPTPGSPSGPLSLGQFAHMNKSESAEVVPLLGDALCRMGVLPSQSSGWWSQPGMVIGPYCKGTGLLPQWLVWRPRQLLYW